MSLPRTVLYIHHGNDLYGADVMLLETIEHLDPAQYRALVVLPEDSRTEGGLSSALQSMGVEQLWLPLAVLRRTYLRRNHLFRYVYDFLRAALGIHRLIKRRQVALVHSNTLAVTAGAVGAWTSGVPHVWHVHEIIRGPTWFRRLLHYMCTRLSSVTLCISKSVRTNILRDEPKSAPKLRVIYNGLSLDRFLVPEARPELRRRLGLPEDVPIIGMVGRINRWKGQGVFVHSAAAVRTQFPDAVFLIIGSVFATEFHYLDDLNREIARCNLENSVRILNFRNDVSDLLAAMDIYVHLSVEPEPFGLAIIEAMASGLPVVATAPGGPGEILEDGISGILVPPRSAERTSEAVSALLSNPEMRQRMGDRARERAFRLFHVSRYATELRSLYKELLSEFPQPDVGPAPEISTI